MNHLVTGPESLFDCLADIAAALRSASRAALFLDFDGTLAPIVENPDQAALPAQSREHLLVLSRRTRVRVSVISGRSLADVERRVGLRQLICAGNHGLEIRGPEINFTHPGALSLAPRLQALGDDLKNLLRRETGCLVEDKGLTLSVHYRRVREACRDEIRRIVADRVAPVQNLFLIGEGLEVLEIRPRVGWTKGSAVRLILSSLEEADTLPVVLGDDITDEDTFAELPDGITVRIGRSASTAARYRLDRQEEVSEFLAWLVALTERDRN